MGWGSGAGPLPLPPLHRPRHRRQSRLSVLAGPHGAGAVACPVGASVCGCRQPPRRFRPLPPLDLPRWIRDTVQLAGRPALPPDWPSAPSRAGRGKRTPPQADCIRVKVLRYSAYYSTSLSVCQEFVGKLLKRKGTEVSVPLYSLQLLAALN